MVGSSYASTPINRGKDEVDDCSIVHPKDTARVVSARDVMQHDGRHFGDRQAGALDLRMMSARLLKETWSLR